ncbi:ribosome small subunit-dependent GTPase A [Virgibacillus sp. W0181]|uniref:ribosome small subunit-dependent GTPase A n=1 Tax=Virgibacillus sp. W0181 TaxID=3391581 RepID=UPI003F48AD8A
MQEGRIVRALSGFYDVKSEGQIFTCRGRGVFRKQKITPLVGDFVHFDQTNEQEGYIIKIEPRTNELIRPPIANITQAIIVTSVVEPDFSTILLDRFLVLIEAKQLKPIILISKKDLANEDQLNRVKEYINIYEKIGYTVKLVSTKERENLSILQEILLDQVTVFAGQSGVGKSSLLNALKPSLLIKTGEISKSLGRGKHTTRHVELVEINGGLVADTPGFSSLDFKEVEANELGMCFPEIETRAPMCQFRGCLHDKEPKCAVKQAVEDEGISNERYKHYINFLKEIQSRKPRYS